MISDLAIEPWARQPFAIEPGHALSLQHARQTSARRGKTASPEDDAHGPSLIKLRGRRSASWSRDWLMAAALLASVVEPASAAVGEGASASACPLEDITTGFARFMGQTSVAQPRQQAAAFALTFAAHHQQFYRPIVFGSHRQLEQVGRHFFSSRASARLRQSAEALEAASAAAKLMWEPAVERFQTVYPDFRCNEGAGIGPSFMLFDAVTLPDGSDKSAVLLGVDALLAYHPPAHWPVVFHHELFHVYHRQVAGWATADLDPVWSRVWQEGLATHAAFRLNPAILPHQLRGSPLRDPLSPSELKAVAKAMLEELHDDGASPGGYFQAAANARRFPHRSGYYIGWLLIDGLAKHRSLDELTRMPVADAKAEVIRVLQDVGRR